MALAAWPAGLPPPVRDSYGAVPTDTRLSTNMSIGHGRLRRRTTEEIGEAQGNYYLSDTEKRDLMDFYSTGTNGGTDWFSLPMVTDGVPAMHEARFKSPPSITRFSETKWAVRVTFTIRRRL